MLIEASSNGSMHQGIPGQRRCCLRGSRSREVLGEGSFGSVLTLFSGEEKEEREGEDRHSSSPTSPSSYSLSPSYNFSYSSLSSPELAIKVYNDTARSIYYSTIQNELDVCTYLKTLKLPGIVEIYDIITEDGKESIVMERLAGGDLFDYVSSRRGSISEQEVSVIFQAMVRIVDEMHRHAKVIHCDLKLENFVFSDTNHQNLKLVDFGSAIRLDGSSDANCMERGVKSIKNRGTLNFRAPELLTTEATSHYSAKSDVWSLGVTLCNLLTNTIPFQKQSHFSTPNYIHKLLKQAEVYRNLSNPVKDLITHILDVDSTTRFTTQDILDHNWCKMYQK